MLSYVRHLLLTYCSHDLQSIPSHGIYQLLTSEHLETFHANFSNAIESSEDYFRSDDPDDRSKADKRSVSQSSTDSSDSVIFANVDAAPPVTADRPIVAQALNSDSHEKDCNSPSRSEEGYGSFSGDSTLDHTPEHASPIDETADEIAALGIIEECEEIPDYGVALRPAELHSISPEKERRFPRRTPLNTRTKGVLSPGASPTRQKLAEMDPVPRVRRIPPSQAGMSDNARNLLSMGYALSIIGEKFEKSSNIVGSVKSVILKAGQAIEKTQNGSVDGKSRFGGSRYGTASRYSGSKFGGSKRSVARTVLLEETLPDWGF